MKSIKLRVHLKPHSSESVQTLFSFGHNHNACNGLSGRSSQRSQIGLEIIVRRFRFPFVGSESWQAPPTWFFTLFRVRSDRKCLHSCVSSGDGNLWCSGSVSFRKRYPDLQVYYPSCVKVQWRVSSASTRARGMFFIVSASWAMKRPSTISVFHCFNSGLIRISTVASLIDSTIGDKIKCWVFEGSHLCL